MLAVYLRQQNSPYAVTSAEGALVGLLAGVIGAVIGVLISIPIDAMMGPFTRQLLERGINAQPDLPPEMSDGVVRASAGGRGAAGVAIQILFLLRTGPRVGMLVGPTGGS